MNPACLVWLDFKTTGLDSNKNRILEVAVMIAPFDDPFNAKLVNHSILWYHPDIIENNDKFVIDMHTKNGLWRACADEDNTFDVFEVEDELLKFVPEVADKEARAVLAGLTVNFDHQFIESWMPKLNKRLSHRHYDVSSFKLFCQSLGMPMLTKGEAHRALEDIKESIEYAKQCEAWLDTRGRR